MMGAPNLHDLPKSDKRKKRFPIATFGAGPGDRLEHVEHDRGGAVHYHSAFDVGAGWSTSDVGLDCRCSHRHSRRHGLERAWRCNAWLGRLLRLPARSLRPRDLWPAHGFRVHLAVHSQRPFGNSLGLYRFRQVHWLYLAGNHGAADPDGRRRSGNSQYRAAISPHHFNRQNYCEPMDRQLANDPGSHSYRSFPF